MNKSTEAIKKNLTIPNILSFIRLLVIIPLVISFMNGRYINAGIYLLISGLSDMFDGMIARKFNQVTQLGKILDPIADKLTLIAVVICISMLIPEIIPLVAILFAKDALMLIGGAVLLCLKLKPPAAKWYGKVATAIFYISIITIVFLKSVFSYENKILIVILMVITIFAMLVAFVSYAKIFLELIKHRHDSTSPEPIDGDSSAKENKSE